MSDSDSQNQRSIEDVQKYGSQPDSSASPQGRRRDRPQRLSSSGPVKLEQLTCCSASQEGLVLSGSPRSDAINLLIIGGSATPGVGFWAAD